MVMDLLGDSLESLYNKCGRKFSLKTVLMLAIQLIDRIEHQHNNHFLHRDIKPDNFLMVSARAHPTRAKAILLARCMFRCILL